MPVVKQSLNELQKGYQEEAGDKKEALLLRSLACGLGQYRSQAILLLARSPFYMTYVYTSMIIVYC